MGKIKSFNEFINESLFGNMTNRGRGETVKKEDDINYLDTERFYEYCKERYITEKSYNISFWEPSDSHSKGKWSRLAIPVFYRKYIINFNLFTYNTDEKVLRVSQIALDSMPEVRDLLEKICKLELEDVGNSYILYPNDGSKITNTSLINIVDFCIDSEDLTNIKKIIKKDEKIK